MKAYVILSALMLFSMVVLGQSWEGFNALKKMIEFEGQSFLMDEVLEISNTQEDKFNITKIWRHRDQSEGFELVISSYRFNDDSGVVLTSFAENVHYLGGSKINYFINIHLSSLELSQLNEVVTRVLTNSINFNKNDQLLRKFSERLTVDISSIQSNWNDPIVSLWIDNERRHTLTKTQWQVMFSKHERYLED